MYNYKTLEEFLENEPDGNALKFVCEKANVDYEMAEAFRASHPDDYQNAFDVIIHFKPTEVFVNMFGKLVDSETGDILC